MTRRDTITTDILVIGSGPGGSVSGALFAEAGRDVLMVEEGEHLSLDSTPHFSRDEMLHKYRDAGIGVALGRQKLAWVEGRCVGGGSEVNRGLYHRTPSYILDNWRSEFRVEHLDLQAMTPHFEACEAVASVEYLPGTASEMSRRLEAGAQTRGWLSIEAPRLFRYAARGDGGGKQSMSATYVPRFLASGGRLMANTRIERLRRQGGRWIAKGIRREPGGASQPVEFSARAVFAACGAVQTPALLRRSGIRHNVGNSLRFHPMVKVVAEFDQDVNRPDDFDPVHQIKEFEPRFGVGCSISKRAMLGMALASRKDHWPLVQERWRRMGIYYIQTTGGVASIRNLPGFSAPLVRVSFSDADMDTFGEALGRLAEVLFAAGAVRIYPGIDGYPELRHPEDLARQPQSLRGTDGSVTSVHVFSSCPMGEDERRTAANSFGKVHNIDGLYIADASLLCTPTVVNPQGTVMAVAHRNAVDALERRFA